MTLAQVGEAVLLVVVGGVALAYLLVGAARFRR